MVECADVEKREGILQLFGDGFVGTARLRGTGGMVMGENDRRGIVL